MNNLRLLTGLLVVALSGGGVRSYCQETIGLEEIFESAERRSAQLKPSLTARSEAEHDISVAKAAMLPDIGASMSLSYIGDGFTCKRDFSDCQKAPIPHFGNSLALEINQPVYTGGALTNAVGLAEMKLTAARYASDFKRDNIRFRLTGFYLDIYKYTNLRKVVVANIVSARKVLGEMRARYEQGTALLNDITRYELMVSEFELQLVKIDNMLQMKRQALVVSMKEIYGWLLIVALVSLTVILVSYGKSRPFAIFPKWSTVRRVIRHLVRTDVLRGCLIIYVKRQVGVFLLKLPIVKSGHGGSHATDEQWTS